MTATAAATSRFQSSPFHEALFKRDGLTYKLAEVPISYVDSDLSVQINKREKHVVDETIEKYANFMRNGAQFPPLIGYEQADGRIVLVDGVQRLNAQLRLKDKNTTVYLIEWITAQDLERLQTEYASKFNQMHGLGYSRAEVESIVVEMRDRGNWTDEQIAEIVGTTATNINNIVHLYSAKMKLVQVGVKLDGLSQGAILQIARLNDEADIKVVARHVQEYPGITIATISDVVSEAKGVINSVARQAAILEGLQADLDKRTKPGKQPKGKKKGPKNTSHLPGAQILGLASYLREPGRVTDVVNYASGTPERRKAVMQSMVELEQAFQVVRKNLASS